MKMPWIGESEEPQSMSAMSDVVFLLLIFFIVTMSGYMEMTLLETNLPVSGGQSTSNPDLQKSVKIELVSDGRCFIQGTEQNRQSLDRLLRRYARLMPDAEFLLQCAPDSKHHMLVSLLGELAKHKLKNIKLLKN